jgi:hypothetical protein
VAISPDGTLLAVGGTSRVGALLDVSSGEALLAVPFDSSISQVAFSADSTMLHVRARGEIISYQLS